ncbi:hypothetical protein KTE23_11220 [Burkholderia multivorans]|uniref:hypothetical protein n=1 Tax=Burkholderia multivorans TaxID=87883 RepID=UPI001C216D81|nr:hypothetical protein [Burkholderia multivorans]MBU9417141.1 hypothetical protein [Burkholderia multivorans]
MIDIKQLATSVTAALIVAVIIGLFKWAASKTKASTNAAMGTAIKTSAIMWKITRQSLFDTVVVGFILYILQGQLASSDPLTRQAVFGIALWTSIMVSYVFSMLLRK